MAEAEQTTVTPTTIFYDYYDDYNDMLCVLENIPFLPIFILVFIAIVVVLSLLGNTLVIVILLKYEDLKSLTNTLIFNLAVSDLFFTTGLPLWVYYYMSTAWTLGTVTCKIVHFVFYAGFYSSGILLILMTVHQYVAVMCPLSNVASNKGFYSVLTSAIVWAVSVLAASPAMTFLDSHHEFCGYVSAYSNSWVIYQQNVFFVLSLVLFIFCFSQIMCRLSCPTPQRRRSNTLKLVFILMIVFLLGWGPYNVVMFLTSFYYRHHFPTCETYKVLQYALNVSQLVAFSHCCLKPVSYVLVWVRFRNHSTGFRSRQTDLRSPQLPVVETSHCT